MAKAAGKLLFPPPSTSAPLLDSTFRWGPCICTAREVRYSWAPLGVRMWHAYSMR